MSAVVQQLVVRSVVHSFHAQQQLGDTVNKFIFLIFRQYMNLLPQTHNTFPSSFAAASFTLKTWNRFVFCVNRLRGIHLGQGNLPLALNAMSFFITVVSAREFPFPFTHTFAYANLATRLGTIGETASGEHWTRLISTRLVCQFPSKCISRQGKRSIKSSNFKFYSSRWI